MMDLHNHTNFSYDGSNTPEEIIEHAIAVGIDTVAVTDHQFSIGSRLDEYILRLEECRERYKKRIRVLIGLEIGTRPVPNDFYASAAKVDFCLFECIDRGGMDLFEFFEWRRMFDCAAGLAHTDIFALSERYGIDTAAELKRRGIFWELNSSGNYNYYYDFLTNAKKRRMVKDSGVVMSAGSDTHYIEEFRPHAIRRANAVIAELGNPTIVP
jgi:predicted metal-dependent phosphoesterase TrpH